MLNLQIPALYLLAGLCEIGGGYLMWQWLKAEQPAWTGLLGATLLIIYGWVATWQSMTFGKNYAVYGGVFILMSIGPGISMASGPTGTMLSAG